MFEQSPAIIINKFGIKEADLILTLLTKEFGKVKAVLHGARGAGKATGKRFSAPPDIFDCGVVELVPPRSSSNLYTLHTFSKKVSFEIFRKDVSRFTLASFCLEACDVLSLDGEPETTKFFNPLYHALNNLNKEELTLTQYSCAVIFFYITILKIAGYDPTNVQCTMLNAQLGEGAQNIDSSLEKDVKLWFRQMLDFNSPILFDSLPLITAAFTFLVSFTESVLEKKLKTSTDLFLALS